MKFTKKYTVEEGGTIEFIIEADDGKDAEFYIKNINCVLTDDGENNNPGIQAIDFSGIKLEISEDVDDELDNAADAICNECQTPDECESCQFNDAIKTVLEGEQP
jgi:hypothetical protein